MKINAFIFLEIYFLETRGTAYWQSMLAVKHALEKTCGAAYWQYMVAIMYALESPTTRRDCAHQAASLSTAHDFTRRAPAHAYR